ncbi:reverse transcriptase domain-containing protein [Tanacetum coccineum]
MMVFHNEDRNPARANIKQALGYLKVGVGRPHKGVLASASSDVLNSFTNAQDGDPLQDDERLCLGDDLKKAQDHKLADRSITYPKGLAEDVYIKVGKFHFPADFVVVDFEADPRVPLILGRSFLKTGRTLIDVYEGEITLRVDNEAVTFNLDQTMKYSSTTDKSINRIDIIDEICEEYVPELLGFPSDDFSSGNPTSTSEPFTSEFTLEEIDAFLYDKSISLESDHDDCDPEEDRV